MTNPWIHTVDDDIKKLLNVLDSIIRRDTRYIRGLHSSNSAVRKSNSDFIHMILKREVYSSTERESLNQLRLEYYHELQRVYVNAYVFTVAGKKPMTYDCEYNPRLPYGYYDDY